MLGSIKKYSSPSETGDHPEMDTSKLLDDKGHRKYQMLIGMLVWVVTVGRIDMAHATSSLSRFTACPRQGHVERLLRVFRYLKKWPNWRIVADSREPIYYKGAQDALDMDYAEELGDQYPETHEEINTNAHSPLVEEMEITVFWTRITRMTKLPGNLLLGRTRVLFQQAAGRNFHLDLRRRILRNENCC
jgi:hypothetical protein